MANINIENNTRREDMGNFSSTQTHYGQLSHPTTVPQYQNSTIIPFNERNNGQNNVHYPNTSIIGPSLHFEPPQIVQQMRRQNELNPHKGEPIMDEKHFRGTIESPDGNYKGEYSADAKYYRDENVTSFSSSTSYSTFSGSSEVIRNFLHGTLRMLGLGRIGRSSEHHTKRITET